MAKTVSLPLKYHWKSAVVRSCQFPFGFYKISIRQSRTSWIESRLKSSKFHHDFQKAVSYFGCLLWKLGCPDDISCTPFSSSNRTERKLDRVSRIFRDDTFRVRKILFRWNACFHVDRVPKLWASSSKLSLLWVVLCKFIQERKIGCPWMALPKSTGFGWVT